MQTSFASASRCPSCVRSSLKTRSSTSFLLTPPHLQPHSLQTLLSSRHRQIVALPACKAAPSQLASSVSLAVPAVSTLVTAITAPAAAWAGETPSATAAADQAVQDLPTVTFGGSLGQWDPVIGVTFYLVVGALTILTLGVLYLSLKSWQDSTDEKKDRAQFSKSSQDRELSEVGSKSRRRRQPPSTKGGGRGFGS